MWQAILSAILQDLKDHPEQLVAILEFLLGLLKSSPALQSVLVSELGKATAPKS
jgi:hypothetical protein